MSRKRLTQSILLISVFFLAGLLLTADRNQRLFTAEQTEQLQDEQLERSKQEQQENLDLLKRLERLEKILTEAEDKVRKKRNELANIAETVGSGDVAVLNLNQQSLLQQLGNSRMELSKIRFKRLRAENELQDLTESQAKPGTETPITETVKSAGEPKSNATAPKTDSANAPSNATKSSLSKPVTDDSDGETDPTTLKLMRDIEKYRDLLEEAERQLAERTKRVVKPVTGTVEDLTRRIKSLARLEAVISDEMKKLEAESKKLGRTTIDVEMKRKEIEALDPIVERISQEIERTRNQLSEWNRKKKGS